MIEAKTLFLAHAEAVAELESARRMIGRYMLAHYVFFAIVGMSLALNPPNIWFVFAAVISVQIELMRSQWVGSAGRINERIIVFELVRELQFEKPFNST